MSVWGVVVAAGRGERAGLGRNKVFYKIGGQSVLARCLDALWGSGLLDGLVVVISKADEEAFRAILAEELSPGIRLRVAYGGASRRDSVHNGLLAVPEDAEIVAIHDAARPFVSAGVMRATLESARAFGSGVISTPVVDTIKQLMPDGSVTTPDRATLRAVQTPQSFDFRRILEAHRRAQAEDLPVTDDAMLFEHYYGAVRLVTAEGAEENRKLTIRADFDALNARSIPDLRVGHGYDVHRLVEGRRLILCGVEIPHKLGLDGHSDADVAVHALMDALLGALGEGDIGKHFPDTDERYRGADSMKLLARVMEIVNARGYRVGNADVTIVAQKPKLLPYMPQMRENLATGLHVSPDRVNVKATTTERLGFEGELLGVSAQAVALLVKEAGHA